MGHGAQTQAVFGNRCQFLIVMGNAPAGTAHGEGGTDDDGITDLVGDLIGFVHSSRNVGFGDRFAQVLHQFFEFLAIFGLINGGEFGAQQFDVQGIQNAGFR